MFTLGDRDRVRDWVLAYASSEPRVVAAAVIGSLAFDQGDRWSDLDLTFAVADEVAIPVVLEEWTRALADQFDAAHLFDLPDGDSIYRVFLLPGCLQLDLSLTPASRFGARGPRFRILFGAAMAPSYPQSPPARELLGHAVHHALRARVCIERGRFWQAEHWIHETRGVALSLACRRLGLATHHGRGFDDLPTAVRDAFRGALVTSLVREELMRALREVMEGLLTEAAEVRDLATWVEPELRRLAIVDGTMDGFPQPEGKPATAEPGRNRSS